LGKLSERQSLSALCGGEPQARLIGFLKAIFAWSGDA